VVEWVWAFLQKEVSMKRLFIDKTWHWKGFTFGIMPCDFALGAMLRLKFYKNVNLVSISFWVHIM